MVVGAIYNYFRDYDSAVGKYIESDPIGIPAGFATYAYVSSRPFELPDPYGLVATTNSPLLDLLLSEKARKKRLLGGRMDLLQYDEMQAAEDHRRLLRDHQMEIEGNAGPRQESG